MPADHRVQVKARDGSVGLGAHCPRDFGPGPAGLHQRLVCRRWIIRISTLTALVAADRLSGATSIVVTSVTGYRRRFPVADADALWLATGFQGGPLTAGTGAPVRLVAPHRGFWWVKWVASVGSSDAPAYAQSPFPLH